MKWLKLCINWFGIFIAWVLNKRKEKGRDAFSLKLKLEERNFHKLFGFFSRK